MAQHYGFARRAPNAAIAASAASLIAMAGKTVEMPEQAMLMIHAENSDCIGWLTERLELKGMTAAKFHATSRPFVVEREATHRAISLAELLDVPMLLVHVSSKEAMHEIQRAQARGGVAAGEFQGAGIEHGAPGDEFQGGGIGGGFGLDEHGFLRRRRFKAGAYGSLSRWRRRMHDQGAQT